MNNQIYKAAHPAYDTIPIKENVDALTECAWTMALVSHWLLYTLSDVEINKAKKCIKNILLASADPYKAYMDLCEGILQARQHTISYKCENTCFPLAWFKGYSNGSLSLPEGKTKRRNCYNVSKRRLIRKAYAEAILNIYEEPTSANFHYWITWFKERKAIDEYLNFSMTTSFNHFKM